MLPGPDVRQDVPAHLRGGARARPAGARRGVPRDLRVARRGRAAAAARPDRAWRATAAAAAAGPPRGPWLLIGLAVVAVLGALLVIGLVGGDDEGDGGQQADGEQHHRDRSTTTPSRSRSSPRAPTPGDAARSRPTNEIYVCVDTGPGHRRSASRASSTSRGPSAAAGCGVNLGKTDVRADGQRQAGADRARARAGRLRVHAAGDQAAPAGRAPLRLMAPAPGIVVTGTEVLTGRVRDRNGPWLSDRLLELGVELAHITICGDRPEDMAAQLALHGRPGRRPGGHERRPGPDRRRPDDRDGGPRSPGGRCSSTRTSRSASRTSCGR